jgi:hypothetical protein
MFTSYLALVATVLALVGVPMAGERRRVRRRCRRPGS